MSGRETIRRAYVPLLRSYTESDSVNSLSIGAEMLYLRLIAASDDYGYYYGDATWVRAKLLTGRMATTTDEQVEGWLHELESLEPVPLTLRFRYGVVTYLRLLNLFRPSRKDYRPKHLFPTEVTTGRDESVTTTLESVTKSGEVSPLTVNSQLSTINYQHEGFLSHRKEQPIDNLLVSQARAAFKKIHYTGDDGEIVWQACWAARNSRMPIAALRNALDATSGNSTGNTIGHFRKCLAASLGGSRALRSALDGCPAMPAEVRRKHK